MIDIEYPSDPLAAIVASAPLGGINILDIMGGMASKGLSRGGSAFMSLGSIVFGVLFSPFRINGIQMHPPFGVVSTTTTDILIVFFIFAAAGLWVIQALVVAFFRRAYTAKRLKAIVGGLIFVILYKGLVDPTRTAKFNFRNHMGPRASLSY